MCQIVEDDQLQDVVEHVMPTHFNLAGLLQQAGEIDPAIRSYESAVRLRPDWTEAEENRELARLRLARLNPDVEDRTGTAGMLGADEIVFDDTQAKGGSTQVEDGGGQPLSAEAAQALWLRRVQTRPGDFLRAKFAYQHQRGDDE